MNIDELSTKLKGMSDFIIPLANAASFDEYSLSIAESTVLNLVSQARLAGLKTNMVRL